MKKVLLLAALLLGTTAMVNAQTDVKTTPVKEVKAKHHHRKQRAEKKAEAAAEAAKSKS
jgi:hypothetical protein